ncbi:glycoside hydrolase family 30 protein [uncultured Bacteroides sp.]|uniref:glycoside hydrolase family 30 protein n=1 Tax=uncultured Bacteroides sp. TaxID=162156 RepID=UPI0025F85396|nr:glycoside hydrolase family 30 protein [uncultured Bacteroides sp.]
MRLISLILLFLLSGTVSAQKVEWYTTTQTSPWVKQKVKPERATTGAEIVLDPTQRLQLITGIGGCFNEMGWDALNALSAEDREAVLQAIFGKDGACFDYCRLPMGANDFAMSFYSSADVAGDFNLVNFNIDRDRYILIPYIKAARQINPDLRVWASPWCPPAWMKTNNHYASAVRPSGEKDVNGLLPREAIAEFSTGFRMEEGYLKTYADYFARFIKAYEAEGLPLECIHVQNEPCSNQVFPSCKWRTEDLTFFLGHYLGPTFERENIKTDIYFGTINTSNPDYVRTALRDEQAAKYIKGVGFQWDGKKAIPTIHREYPDLNLMQTETECGNGANSWDYAEYTWNLMKHYFSNGINSYHYWNMILPTPGISPWGWNQNSMVSIDKKQQTVKYNPEFYLMKHLGHLVQTGAYRLETPSDKNMLAFVNPDGTVSVIVANVTDTEEMMSIEIGGQKITLTLPPHSFHTVSWKK